MCDYGLKKLQNQKEKLKKKLKCLHSRKKTPSENEPIQTQSPIQNSHEVYTIYENFEFENNELENMFQIFKDKINKMNDSHVTIQQKLKSMSKLVAQLETNISLDKNLIKELKNTWSQCDSTLVEHVYLNESLIDFSYKLCLKFLYSQKKIQEAQENNEINQRLSKRNTRYSSYLGDKYFVPNKVYMNGNRESDSLISSYKAFNDSKLDNEYYYDTVSHLTTNSALAKNTMPKRMNLTSNNRLDSERNSRLSSSFRASNVIPPIERINYNDINSLKPIAGITQLPRQRRTSILPRPTDKSSFKMLKDILKNANGKDLSKIPMPCNFSEPLSFLQRYAEVLEYSHLLDKAAECEDSLEQMALVAAFTVSSCAASSERKNKPFNPMLGETFEYDRLEDYGWRYFSEQVSHHPPGIAAHVESLKDWTLSFDVSMVDKFRGNYVEIQPNGTHHLKFNKTGNHYTWNGVKTFANNILVGQLWINFQGETNIVNHKTKEVCLMKYFPYSYFSNSSINKVMGIIKDSNNQARYVLNGICTEKLEASAVLNPQFVKTVDDYKNLSTDSPFLLWKRFKKPDYLQAIYNFTQFSIQLNEPEENVAPTDSRLRPDQRLMEEIKWDEANQEKLILEENQRQRIKQKEKLGIKHEPVWFKKTIEPITNELIHTFEKQYWGCKARQEWKNCPDIFNLNSYKDNKL